MEIDDGQTIHRLGAMEKPLLMIKDNQTNIENQELMLDIVLRSTSDLFELPTRELKSIWDGLLVAGQKKGVTLIKDSDKTLLSITNGEETVKKYSSALPKKEVDNSNMLGATEGQQDVEVEKTYLQNFMKCYQIFLRMNNSKS